MRFPDGSDALSACYPAFRRTHKRRRRGAAAGLAIVLAGVTCLAGAAGAQPLPEVEVDVISPRVYAAAVDAYAEGRHDEAMARVTRVVPAAVLVAARSTLPAFAADAADRAPAGVARSADAQGAVRRWRAAAVLHLDTAFRLAQRYHAGAVAPHLAALDVALDRLEAADRQEDAPRFRSWCTLARLHHLTVAGLPQEFDLVANRRPLPEVETDVLFARGVSHETRSRAIPPPLGRRPTRAAAALAGATAANARRVWYERHLKDAARAYEAVLVRAPGHAEATLRLARVRLERHQPDEALAALAALATTPCEEPSCALAWLTRGEAHEARLEYEAARAAYRHATAVASVYPTAIVALHALPDAEPSRVGTLDVPAESRPLSGPSDGRQTPRDEGQPTAWRSYLLGVTAAHGQLMQSLREAVR